MIDKFYCTKQNLQHPKIILLDVFSHIPNKTKLYEILSTSTGLFSPKTPFWLITLRRNHPSPTDVQNQYGMALYIVTTLTKPRRTPYPSWYLPLRCVLGLRLSWHQTFRYPAQWGQMETKTPYNMLLYGYCLSASVFLFLILCRPDPQAIQNSHSWTYFLSQDGLFLDDHRETYSPSAWLFFSRVQISPPY